PLLSGALWHFSLRALDINPPTWESRRWKSLDRGVDQWSPPRRISMRLATIRSLTLFLALALLATAAFAGSAANYAASLTAGKAQLKSAGSLAFGPDGILFIGDPMGAAIFAIDTGDRASAKTAPLSVQGLDAKVAALLGTAPDQILINDMAVNPISKK